MVGDRGRGGQGVDVFRVGVDHADQARGVARVAQTLDAAGGRAGADGDQHAGLGADLPDAVALCRGGYRSLDQRQVVRPIQRRPGGLQEVGDTEPSGDRE